MIEHTKKVIIIGAGWSGLAAAKTYLRIEPSIDLLILDDGDAIGGVWNSSRVYPGLEVDSPTGLFEFSDMTMIDKAHPFLSRIQGDHVSAYLERYAKEHQLDSHIRLKTKVVKVWRARAGWTVRTQSGEDLHCDKLIVSTGLASQAKLPTIPNVENGFSGPVMHTYALGTEHHRLTDPVIKTVIVVGGSKSAIETVCLCIDAGKFVHWIIRPDGGGASMMIVTDKDNPRIIALNATRIFNVFAPSIFAASGFWYKFLHSQRSRLGNKVENLYWRKASKVVHNGPKYGKSTNGDKVRPISESVFWNPNCISLIDKNSKFLDYLHDHTKLDIRRDTVTYLSHAGAHLASGETIRADAIVYATGWEKSSSFFDKDMTVELGLPAELAEEPTVEAGAWARRHAVADNQVKSMLPELLTPPDFNLPQPTKTPYRLYRNVIPPKLAARGDRSIAFAGMLVTSQTVIFSEISALYAVAYLEELLPSPSLPLERMNEDIALVNAWTKARYGYRGVREPLNMSEQTFFDALCRDLHIKTNRKRGSKAFLGFDRLVREWCAPYRAGDYRGLVDEFLVNRREREECQQKSPRSSVSSQEIGSKKLASVLTMAEICREATLTPISTRMGHGLGLVQKK